MTGRSFTAVALLSALVVAPAIAHAQAPEEETPMFRLHNPRATQLSGRVLAVAPGIQLDIGDYVQMTSMRTRSATKQAFTGAFQSQFLKVAPVYQEEVEGLSDRLRVTRTLTLDYKDPCDANIPKDLRVCFSATKKSIKPEVAADLNKTRDRIRAQLKRRPRGRAAKRYRQLLGLSDAELIDQLLNQGSSKKTITHTSVVPYISYEFGNVPLVDLSTTTARLPAGARLPRRLSGGIQANAPIRHIVDNVVPPGGDSGQQVGPEYRFQSVQRRVESLVMGFTIGRHASDTFEVEFAESTSVSDRYYARFSYTFSYGVGVRLPMQLRVRSQITRVNDSRGRMLVPYPARSLCSAARSAEDAALCAAQAQITINATPLDADEDYYRRAGVPEDQLFGGKEFVFEAGLTCRLYASIPGPNIPINCPSGLTGKSLSQDFTPHLGSDSKRLFRTMASGRDLGLGIDGGLGYAVINPGARLGARNSSLTVEPRAWRSTFSPTRLLLNGGAKTLTVSEAVERGRAPWGIILDVPSYRMAAELVPLLEAEIGIDLGVYDWSMKFGPYVLGSLRVDLGSFEFNPHRGTRSSFQLGLGTRAEP